MKLSTGIYLFIVVCLILMADTIIETENLFALIVPISIGIYPTYILISRAFYAFLNSDSMSKWQAD
jgi:hypothetical protein